LKDLNKPFIILLNTIKPYAPETDKICSEISNRYNVPVVPVNCAQLKPEDLYGIMEKVLYEFPVKEIKINFPKWIETLALEHWLKKEMIATVKNGLNNVVKLRELKDCVSSLEANQYAKKAYVDKIELGEGSAGVEVSIDDSLFYRILSETTGMDIAGEYQLISTIKVLSEAKREYDKVKYALEEVKQKGYGIVTPALDEMKLDDPTIVRHGSRYGVKLKASAPSIHIKRIKQKYQIPEMSKFEKEGFSTDIQFRDFFSYHVIKSVLVVSSDEGRFF
jgi:stage IV sporulation protein A